MGETHADESNTKGHAKMNTASIIIEGNIFDGHTFHGPFEDHEDAIEWAERNLKTDWLVATLRPAETE